MDQTPDRFVLRSAGPRAILVEFDNPAAVQDFYTEALRRRADGRLADIVELVPSARTLLLDELDDQAAVARDLRTWRPERTAVASQREIRVPTVYDGFILGLPHGLVGRLAFLPRTILLLLNLSCSKIYVLSL